MQRKHAGLGKAAIQNGMVPRRRLGRLRLATRFPWARFGGGGGAVLAGLSAARGATYTGGAPPAVGRDACWAILVRVAVSVLRLWAECQGQDDKLWMALTNRPWPPHHTHGQLRLRLP